MGKPQSSLKKIGEKTLTGEANKKDKEIEVLSPKVVVFFVGGAADKRPYGGAGPNGNILMVYYHFVEYFKKELNSGEILASDVLTYLGYYEIYGDDNIKKNVIQRLSGKAQSIIIIGHSLGGWNGAWLADKLTVKGYKVSLLITLDPVGVGHGVRLVSDVYNEKPAVEVEYWVNLEYSNDGVGIVGGLDTSNVIANLGGRFNPKGRRRPMPGDPDINDKVPVDHYTTINAMMIKTSAGETTWDILKFYVKKGLK